MKSKTINKILLTSLISVTAFCSAFGVETDGSSYLVDTTGITHEAASSSSSNSEEEAPDSCLDYCNPVIALVIKWAIQKMTDQRYPMDYAPL